jgi:hypothetical protein
VGQISEVAGGRGVELRLARAPPEGPDSDIRHAPAFVRIRITIESISAVGGTSTRLSFLFHLWFDHILSQMYLQCIMHVRARNAVVIIHRPADANFQIEVFEGLPSNIALVSAKGKLICSYPGPAIQVSGDIFMDGCFLLQFPSFLVQMDVDVDVFPGPTDRKAGSAVVEACDTTPDTFPDYWSAIWSSSCCPSHHQGIGDEVLYRRSQKPSRRSPLWLVLRAALQSSLHANDHLYKHFMLFFHAHLLRRGLEEDLPSDPLHVMRTKVARRLSKLHPAVSERVHEFVHNTAKETGASLSKRWTKFEAEKSIGRVLKSDTLDFNLNTHISRNASYDYLTKALDSESLTWPLADVWM